MPNLNSVRHMHVAEVFSNTRNSHKDDRQAWGHAKMTGRPGGMQNNFKAKISTRIANLIYTYDHTSSGAV